MKIWQLHNTSGICEGLYRHGILVVVLLYIVEARVLVASCLLADFLCLWYDIVAKADGIFCGLVAEAMGAMEWAFAVGVLVATGGGWVALYA
jgi:hypothetical protein